jgi:plasmid stability protein
MKTTLDLPDELMREIKILAAREGRKMKDIISESLRRDLRIGEPEPRPSLREMEPVSVGRILCGDDSEDLIEI